MMKDLRLPVTLAVAACLAACAVYVPAGRGVVYTHVPPPAAQIEVAPAAPGSAYVWTPGYWAWGGVAYAWNPGRWVIPPPGYRTWHPGFWEHGPNGHHWTPGHWR
jgi:hypothetical protein